MKLNIVKQVTIDVKTLVVKAEPRYWEDALVNGIREDDNDPKIPCKKGDIWELNINIDTGQINNWIEGVTADVNYKVCDCCSWYLLDENSNIVYSNIDDYVPDFLMIDDYPDGDYIALNINEKGFIKDWDKSLIQKCI